MYGSYPLPQALARGGGQRLLVAAGDPDTAELLTSVLELAGYRTGVADSGAELARRLAEHRFDLVVLDAELSGLDDLARGGRFEPAYRPPVLLLAACESLARLVPELRAGERDCVTKPFRIAELLARVKVLLRDVAGGRRGGMLDHADLVLDDGSCRARRGGRTLDLTPAEYRLLRHLLVNSRKVLSKEQISRYVWGEFRGGNAIEQLVSRLRRKVDGGGPALIHTRRGFGYWLGESSGPG
ncbi:response regulator transcription factor [Streptomyces fuscichromogenes]|uniref:DNA-binding response regulator n=1 Tax=Streptomyces fuscichromogenes TaxID=1324013 RepID=A0A918CT81_9ACTN|nr:response regulator transcription factor [Streptomyces fuscichromogenes]GGN20689.1 DNA-binding response regulator [Streptomyces fuscichromogenes]